MGNDLKISFQSTHGATQNLSDTHELEYFWAYWLGSGTEIKRNEDVDYPGLSDQLHQIRLGFERPVAHKELLTGMHIEDIVSIVPDALFIWMRRDPLDMGMSILRTREERYGDCNQWWSLRPPGWEHLFDQPGQIQIAEQIRRIDKFFEASLTKGFCTIRCELQRFMRKPLRGLD